MKSENDKQFDCSISDKLTDDLTSLYEPGRSVPPQVDRAVMDRAARRIQGRPKRRRLLYWPVYAASAAAIILVCILLSDITEQTPPQTVAGQMDINRDGVVDVLDAFKLAKLVDAESSDLQWDMNGDGIVDGSDVDMIAGTAVQLDREVL